METALRKLLIICGVLLLIAGILSLLQYVISYSLYLIGISIFDGQPFFAQGLLSLIITLVSSFQPIAIGSLCLYAAHRISPLKNLFEKK